MPHLSLHPKTLHSQPQQTAWKPNPVTGKSFTLLSTGPPQAQHGTPISPIPPWTTQYYPTTNTQNQRGMRGVFDGKGLNAFNHHFLPAGIKPR